MRRNKEDKEITSEEFKKLQQELAKLKKQLIEERLRADFTKRWSHMAKKFMVWTSTKLRVNNLQKAEQANTTEIDC